VKNTSNLICEYLCVAAALCASTSNAGTLDGCWQIGTIGQKTDVICVRLYSDKVSATNCGDGDVVYLEKIEYFSKNTFTTEPSSAWKRSERLNVGSVKSRISIVQKNRQFEIFEADRPRRPSRMLDPLDPQRCSDLLQYTIDDPQVVGRSSRGRP
jgi:hypothetical protein